MAKTNNSTNGNFDMNALKAMMRKTLNEQRTPNPAAELSQMTIPTPKKSKASKILGTVADLAGMAAPLATAVNPAVGMGLAALKAAVSANDDRWFGEHKPAGATFSEILQNKDYKDVSSDPQKVILQIPALTEIATDFDSLKPMEDTYSTEASDSELAKLFMPSVLAFVRKKTNNVLLEDHAKYSQAFYATIRLVSIYYSMKKYELLAQKLPLNAGTLTLTVPALKPALYNQMIGIATSLCAYLKETVGLPYPLQAYLRWRYGTVFHSDNTGRPGLVVYDPCVHKSLDMAIPTKPINWCRSIPGYAEDFISLLQEDIAICQNVIQGAGRAAADLHLAYIDSQHKWDVDVPHHDEKEYNLRMNITGPTRINTDEGLRVVLDSRLDPSAALQAVTLSVANRKNYNDLRTSKYSAGLSLADVNHGNNDQLCFLNTGDPRNYDTLTPFPVRDIIFLFNQSQAVVLNDLVHTSDNTTAWVADSDGSWAWVSACAVRAIAHAKTDAATDDRIDYYDQWSDNPLCEIEETFGTVGGVRYDKYKQSLPISTASHTAVDLVKAGLIAMQCHNQSIAHIHTDSDHSFYNAYVMDTLSYDTAVISISQINAIQNMAIRNLIRGDYTHDDNQLAGVKEEVVEITKEITEPVVKENQTA